MVFATIQVPVPEMLCNILDKMVCVTIILFHYSLIWTNLTLDEWDTIMASITS